MRFRCFAFFLFAFPPAIHVWAAPSIPAGIKFTADKVRPDLATGEMMATGHVRWESPDLLLLAEEIRYDSKQDVITARGNVTLQRQGYRLLAQEIIYRRKDESYSVTGVRLGSDPVFISGSKVTGDRSTITIEDAVATFQEPGVWTPTVRARRFELHIGQSVTVEGGRVGISKLQPLPLPAIPIPMDQLFLKYASFGAGYHGYLGAFLEFGLHLPVRRGIEVGGDLGYYSNRGFLFGPSGRYARGSEDRGVWGEFGSGFIHDSGDKLQDILGNRIAEDRGWINWEHRQRFNEQLSLTAEVRYWSDSEVVRDFRPKEFYPHQKPDTFVETTYTTDALILSGFVRPKINRYFLVQERLPEFRADLLPQIIGAPEWGVYQRGHASIARLIEDAPAAGPTLRSDRFDAYYSLTHAFRPKEWFTVTPVAGVELTHYGRTNEGSGKSDYTRTLGEVGVDAELHANATFPYRNEAWKIDGLRHLLTPRVSYRYIPRADRGRPYIPPIDQRDFSTYLQPLGLGDRRDTDVLGPTHTLRLEIDNTLQTRDATYGSRNLTRLDVAADVRFDRDPGERRLSDLHADLSITPLKWLAFDLYQSFSLRDGQFRELNTGLTITNSEWWSLRLATHYLSGDVAEYVADGIYRLNEVFEGFSRLHFDARRSRFVQQTYGIRHNLDNFWVIGYGMNFYEGRRRESSFGLFIQVETARF